MQQIIRVYKDRQTQLAAVLTCLFQEQEFEESL